MQTHKRPYFSSSIYFDLEKKYHNHRKNNNLPMGIKTTRWHVWNGFSYGRTILSSEGGEILKKVISTREISWCKLRQDKKINKYFWIGMKIAQKILID